MRRRGKGYLFFIGLASLGIAAILGGCSKVVLLHPGGPIGNAERNLIIEAFGLMLIVVIPVIAMALWFPLKYSASNKKAVYAPKWSGSLRLELVFWLVPVAIVAVLGYLAWSKTHQLDPYRPIEKGVRPINVQVVAMDWKWLFIYPDQKIAVVNKLVFPVGVPLSFMITSDTVMNSFFIPQLGSQMYAMAGMVTRLNLKADRPGVYYGQSQAFSGKGYADMSFQARAVSLGEFEGWLEKVGRSPHKLDSLRFKELQKPSTANHVAYFSNVAPGLFDLILRQYAPMGSMSNGKVPATTIDILKSAAGGH
ncbi:MAG: ubiquinol oxidase subunit II [Syntrophobacteraceae bacterium]|nr:ubiquinol oxidase subunit II [Syntrophobacteraceae bacterium]